MGTEDFIRYGGGLDYCQQHILQRAERTSLEAIGPNASNCFSRGVRTSISKETYILSSSEYPGEGPNRLPPPWIRPRRQA